ncbi:hypothetical protein TIFTF001_036280 [Ficus carica]|uniref:Uncharacterized protein n=1 Tax=Ficus carica TaxID=3494 RepID=A0AA88J7H1_FICCA|nr:hypothetical protein TIFTF001_036280 [Ficus carica]
MFTATTMLTTSQTAGAIETSESPLHQKKSWIWPRKSWIDLLFEEEEEAEEEAEEEERSWIWPEVLRHEEDFKLQFQLA